MKSTARIDKLMNLKASNNHLYVNNKIRGCALLKKQIHPAVLDVKSGQDHHITETISIYLTFAP